MNGGKIPVTQAGGKVVIDRKSTRLNSSHVVISYAVFCLKKKKETKKLFNAKMIAHMHTQV